jgi:hypothetical protein
MVNGTETMVSGVEKIFSVIEKIFSVTKTMVEMGRRANRNIGNGLTGL